MIIHQYWHNEEAPYPIFREFLRFHYDSVLWTPDTMPDVLRTLVKQIEGTCRPEDEHRHAANLVRYWTLYEYGGVWIDIDVFPIKSLDRHPLPYVAAHGTPCTCVMAFDAGHPMLERAIDSILSLPLSDASCVDVSGDHLLGQIITPDVTLRQLPYDAVGCPITDGSMWAIHLYQSRVP